MTSPRRLRALANTPLRETMQLFRSHPGFLLALLLALALAGLNAAMILLMQLKPGFLGMAHFSQPSHRIHDLAYGFIFGTAIVGILAQLRRPSSNVAAMIMALLPWGGLLLAALLSWDARVILSSERVAAAVVITFAALLHPARRVFFRSFSRSRVNWVMLALVFVVAVPLLALAATHVGLQASIRDDHAAMGHYGFVAAFAFTVIGVGTLASLRPVGWRLTAWVAGLLPAFLGVASLLYPDGSSSLGLGWAFAAMAWGAAFIAAAEVTKGTVPSAPSDGPVALSDQPEGGFVGARTGSRWIQVAGVVLVGLLAVFFGARLMGFIGGGGHGGGAIEGAVNVEATEFAFQPGTLQIPSGEFAIALRNVGSIEHDFLIEGVDDPDAGHRIHAEPGETSSGTYSLAPGSYTFYCSIPGHRQNGMEGTLTVSGGPHDPSNWGHA